MIHFGSLISGDFGDNTMTFEIDGKMELKPGKYAIVPKKIYDLILPNISQDIEKL